MTIMEKKVIFEDRSRVKAARRIQELVGDSHPHVSFHLSRINDLATTPITLAVMGEFSAGKSTFINKLLATDALPVSILPKTATITRVVFGESPRVEIESIQDGNKIIRDEPGYESLKKLQNAKKISDEKFKNEISNISEVRVYVNNPLLKKFSILDTPGFNHDDVMDQKTMGVLSTAHVIVWLSDYTQLAKRTEFERLEELRSANDRIHLVINKTDVHVTASEAYKETEDNVLKQLSDNKFLDLFCTKEIYLISCKTEQPFWDGMFQQFQSRFGRAVLEQDIALSIELIGLEWESLKGTIFSDREQYQKVIGCIRNVSDLCDTDDFISQHLPSAIETLRPDIAEVATEVVKHCERSKDLCTSKVPAANLLVSDLLRNDLYSRFESMSQHYSECVASIVLDYVKELLTAVSELYEALIDGEQEEKLALEIILGKYRLFTDSDLGLNLVPRAASRVCDIFDHLCFKMLNQAGTEPAENISLLLQDALEIDLNQDLQLILRDRALSVLIPRLKHNVKNAIERLDNALKLTEV